MNIEDVNRIITQEAREIVEKYERIVNNIGHDDGSLEYLIIDEMLTKMKVYAGKTFSNSMYIHSLAEIEYFRRIGIDPLSRDISKIFNYHPQAHHEGLKMEHLYLQLVLNLLGVPSSLGTIMTLNPTREPFEKRSNKRIFNKLEGKKFPMIKSEKMPTIAAFDRLIREEPRLLQDMYTYDFEIIINRIYPEDKYIYFR